MFCDGALELSCAHLRALVRTEDEHSSIRRHVEKTVLEPQSVTVGGWAYDANAPDHHVIVRALLDGKCIGLAFACQMREDLATAGMSKGDHAFLLRLPLPTADRLSEITLTFDGKCDWRLAETTHTYTHKAPPSRRLLCLDAAQVQDDTLSVSGWILEPDNPGARAIVVCELGEQKVEVEACQVRLDLAVPGWPRDCGFFAQLALTSDQTPSQLVVRTLDGAQVERFPTWFNFDPPLHAQPENAGGMIGSAHVHNGELRGWILSETGDAGFDLRIEEGGRLIWRGPAQRLTNVPLNGKKQRLPCGFRVALPRVEHPTLLRSISILLRDGQHAPGSPICFPDGLEFTGYVEGVGKAGDSVIVTGWCVNRARPSQTVEVEAIDANGAVLASTSANAPRPDLKKLGIETPYGGFRLEINGSSVEATGQRGLRIRPANTPGALPAAATFLHDVAALRETTSSKETQELAHPSDEIEGNIDEITSTHVRGWARSKTGERLVFLDLFLDNVLIATAAARRFRSDLAALFRDHGCHEFVFELTSPLIWQASSVKVQPRTGVGELSSMSNALPFREIANTAISWAPARLASRDYVWETNARPQQLGVSIVVLNRNGAPLLEEMFQSFAEHNAYENIEFIVVDHASRDNSEAVCLRWKTRFAVDFARRDGNYSFSNSNNWGASRATGDVVLFINNDVRLCEDVVPAMIRHLSDDRTGCVGIRLLDDTLEDRSSSEPRAYAIQHLGVHLNLSPHSSKVIAPFETRFSRLWGRTAHRSVRVPAVTGAFLAMRKVVFDRIGGFDEAYYYGQEDVDLCLRVRAAGLEVICANEVSALHLRAYSRDMMETKYHHARRRNALTLDKKLGLAVRRALAKDRYTRPSFWTGEAPRIAFVVTSTDPATQAGDLFTARELASALAEKYPVTCVFVEQDGPHVRDLSGIDAVIVMRDDFDPDRIQQHDPHLLKVAWIRNWFQRFADSAHADRYHAVWSSSDRGARLLSENLGRPVGVLPIATNASAFAPRERDDRYESDYCFTGSYWSANREIIQMLEPAALPYDFALFGQGWETVPAMRPYARGFVRYTDMPLVYSSTKVVVDDANHATKAFGSVNSRVYDAIAAGAVVLTNGVLGAREQFGDALPVYSTPQELEALLHLYLTDEPARQAKAAELRAIVLERHTYSHRAEAAWGKLCELSSSARIAIKIGAPNRSVRDEWGDWHFARGMQEALEALGYAVRIDCLSEWSNRESAADDIVFVLRGLSQYAPRQDQINLLWVISHPDLISEGEYRAYDHVFVASELFRKQLRRLLGDNVSTLLQCTNPRFFHPGVAPAPNAATALFVGNSREQRRPIVADAIEAGLDLHVHGTRWDGFIADRYIKSAHIPNERLAAHYRAAGVVLNDHWPSMRERGFISNRVFDALAAGARLVSDDITGLSALSGDLVRVYSTPEDLKDICRSLLGETLEDQERRDETARRIVRDHSFNARMQEASLVIQRLLDARLIRLA